MFWFMLSFVFHTMYNLFKFMNCNVFIFKIMSYAFISTIFNGVTVTWEEINLNNKFSLGVGVFPLTVITPFQPWIDLTVFGGIPR